MNAFYLLAFSTLWSVLALFLIILLRKRTGELLKSGRNQWLQSFALGLLNPVFYYLVLFRSYELLPAQIAQPLNYTWPIVLILLSAPLLGQKIQLLDFVSLGLCFAGVLLISSSGSGGESSYSLAGISLALFSSLIWASYWIFNRKTEGDRIIRLFQTFLCALPVLLLIGLLTSPAPPVWSAKALTATIYVGFFEMGITFALWSAAMHLSVRSADIGNLVYLSPFLSLFWISLILKEKIFLTTLLGLITIVGGILLGNLKKKAV